MRGRLCARCSKSPASRGVQWSRTGAKFRGPIHPSPSGSLPRPFGPRGSVLVKIASRQHISINCWSEFCTEYRRIILARRLLRCGPHRARLFVHRVPYPTKRGVRGPERGRQTVAQEDTNHPRGTSSSGPWRRWLNKSPNGVSAMPSRVLRSGCAAPQTEPAAGRSGGCLSRPGITARVCDAHSSHTPAKEVIHRRVEIASRAL